MRPKCVMVYNDTMGVESDYSTPWKRGMKYLKKKILNTLNVEGQWAPFFTGWIMFRKSYKHHSEEMVSWFQPTREKPSNIMNTVRLTEWHFPDYILATGKKANPTYRCTAVFMMWMRRRWEHRFYYPECDTTQWCITL